LANFSILLLPNRLDSTGWTVEIILIFNFYCFNPVVKKEDKENEDM